jgi:hypothetical protein
MNNENEIIRKEPKEKSKNQPKEKSKNQVITSEKNKEQLLNTNLYTYAKEYIFIKL